MNEQLMRRLLALERRVEHLVTREGVPRWVALSGLTLTQSGSVTFSAEYARYAILGKIAHVQLHITATAAGTAANAVVIGGLPSAIAPQYHGAFRICGWGIYRDTGTTQYPVAVEMATATTLKLLSEAGDYFGIAPAVTIASTDEIALDLMYEMA